jgi:hypothetical protein
LQYDEFVGWLTCDTADVSQGVLNVGESAASDCPAGMKACRYGAKCFNRKPDHLMNFWHPDHWQAEGKQRQACKFGAGCFRKQRAHLDSFVHPGDKNYRKGLVIFKGRQKPQFETIEQLFNYFDPEETGYLNKDAFHDMLKQLSAMKMYGDASDVETPWEAADGNASGYLNFARVAEWGATVGIDLPLGLDTLGDKKPCRFRIGRGGWSCPCDTYEPSAGSGSLCACGHKPSAHRADICIGAAKSEALEGLNWAEGKTGLVEVEDADLIAKMQDLFMKSHKTHNNWTRDRGCKIHGRGHKDCDMSCIRANGNPVPTGFQVVKVFRNQNRDLWNHYAITKKQIMDDLKDESPSGPSFEAMSVWSQCDLDAPLDFEICNEWRLFHGTSLPACQGIAATNFRLSMSGSGATWKEPGAEKGSPLYGFGIYLGESITKSDEYAGDCDDGLNCVLVCRAVGGLSQLCETNEIDKAKLKDDVFNGQHHSVFGDRVRLLGKPYREVVLYDKDQIFPEFLVYYKRLFD